MKQQNLLKAYAELPVEITNNYDLILPGQAWSGSEAVFDFWRQMSLKMNVHFPGFVDDATMAALYKKASLYVFPSYYEGFGIPLLEAMSNGVPILCSNTPSLVEVGGEAVELFEPDSISSIKDKITEVVNDTDLQFRLVNIGYQRVKEFSWRKHSEALIAIVVDK